MYDIVYGDDKKALLLTGILPLSIQMGLTYVPIDTGHEYTCKCQMILYVQRSYTCRQFFSLSHTHICTHSHVQSMFEWNVTHIRESCVTETGFTHIERYTLVLYLFTNKCTKWFFLSCCTLVNTLVQGRDTLSIFCRRRFRMFSSFLTLVLYGCVKKTIINCIYSFWYNNK